MWRERFGNLIPSQGCDITGAGTYNGQIPYEDEDIHQ
jgi:hypothetical protein